MRQIFFAVALTITLAGLFSAAPQKKGCEELKGEIAAKLGYSPRSIKRNLKMIRQIWEKEVAS